MKKYLCFLFFLFFKINYTLCQVKFEKEERIKPEAVPESALALIQKMPFSNKIKWYRETALDRTSIEAKTKHDGKKHSIEFSKKGQVEDIEIRINWKEMPVPTQCTITEYLDKTYEIARIRKVQIQYTGSETALLKRVNSPNATQAKVDIKYEIVLEAKKEDDKPQLLEYLFSAEGDVLEKSVITFRNTDNLEY